MDCTVCNFRSALGTCVVCDTMLCEVCGVTCERCGKMACGEHVHETSRHRLLCEECYEKRKAARKEAKKKASGLIDDDPLEHHPKEEKEVEEEEYEVLGKWEPPPSWKLSIYSASVGAAAVLIMLIFPNLRGVKFSPNGSYIPIPYAIFVAVAFAVFWAARGLIKDEDYLDRRKCFIGLGIALATSILILVAVFTDKNRRMAMDANKPSERDSMTPRQLQEWREKKLGISGSKKSN